MDDDESPRRSMLLRALDEVGLVSLYHSPKDVKFLCMQRFVRLFAYGASTLVLVLYLQALGNSKTRIGLFMTLTLAGDVCISLALTLVADRLGRKAVLALGAALMSGAGVAFALFENYWVLLVAAIFGVISPSGNEIGPFRAIEESVVAHLSEAASRSDIYAWYSLLGSAGSACGFMTCGWVVHHLSHDRHWELINAYRFIFVGYAVLGLVKFTLALLLSRAVEADDKSELLSDDEASEDAPLLSIRDDEDIVLEVVEPEPTKRRFSLLPDISKESYAILLKLCLLFGLDAFASGLASLSWMTYFFRWRYGIEEGRLGSIFFTASIITAISMLVASSLAKRIGNIKVHAYSRFAVFFFRLSTFTPEHSFLLFFKTMVFTHLPSSVFLSLIGLVSDARLSLLLLFLRASTQSMDTAPRSAFIAAIILPQERTVMMGFINVVKTMAQSLGPIITGILADHGLFWVAFLAAGALKSSYDLGLLAVFKNRESREEEHGAGYSDEQGRP
ncbi:putative membrane protein [Cladobotryum mycophilum]|uniref:Membrane protein n=1 Tax=Cladobotryum mycophilum TaxID=491253 RepID=A0ABR0T442_9HYPO